jgi:hypothetical protein
VYTVTNCLVHRNSVEQPGQTLTKVHYIPNCANPCFRLVTRKQNLTLSVSLMWRSEKKLPEHFSEQQNDLILQRTSTVIVAVQIVFWPPM